MWYSWCMKYKRPRERGIWTHIKGRCNNAKDPRYKDYGGRGITYDPKWENFLGFWKDMHQGYADNLSIDRINVNGNYCKKNCRWATKTEQQRNMRNSLQVTHEGRTQSIHDWADELGVAGHTLFSRIQRGWSVESTLKKNVNSKMKKIEYGGKSRTIQEWADFLGISRRCFYSRLWRGLPKEKLFSSGNRKVI